MFYLWVIFFFFDIFVTPFQKYLANRLSNNLTFFLWQFHNIYVLLFLSRYCKNVYFALVALCKSQPPSRVAVGRMFSPDYSAKRVVAPMLLRIQCRKKLQNMGFSAYKSIFCRGLSPFKMNQLIEISSGKASL